jgi:hypothetical protein
MGDVICGLEVQFCAIQQTDGGSEAVQPPSGADAVERIAISHTALALGSGRHCPNDIRMEPRPCLGGCRVSRVFD